MWQMNFIGGPREGQQDMVFGRSPLDGESVWYVWLGAAAGWVRVLESWAGQPGTVTYKLKTSGVKPYANAGQLQGEADYEFVGEVPGGKHRVVAEGDAGGAGSGCCFSGGNSGDVQEGEA